MLTADIKQKIDNARNILVGKIPTPTGQVEQITLALVYKFMNDIDEQNKELGGELKFFTGDYSKYAWKHLLDKGLSAYERVTAYGEGLEKMHLNPNLPQFFRNVFKGAFLPFRDPEVLTIFLKQIDEFHYGANGDLGDAFEYLLQVMGTQGDAGQFLTPRHIINFIVSIVDPQKTDKILDPAEGTAGFLISSFLHILKNNTKPDSNLPGSALTYDERKKLSENLVGYDISHDMVRLSLVNLYLHGFADPKIYEYDTLGNLDRWDDDFDCIETNPPFMTPKGGVKPHKRFSIQAKRSEVLFVDYIMEHLNPNGKAGIIVPEGIIFQSATAYKALRKMMVDQNFLYAVVSLPAGVFNPYAGVKTSILLMDRVLAKKTKDILFVKIENDGFDLGAQRRPIDKNDLPQAAEILKRYKMSIQTGKPFELFDEDKKIASLVPIEKISKSGDYNLSGDRYKETIVLINQKWPMIELGNDSYFTIESGGTPESSNPLFWNGKVNWVTLVDLPQNNFITEITSTERSISEEGLRQSSAKLLPINSILVSSRATIGRVAINKIPVATNQGFKNIIIQKSDRVNSYFVAYMMTNLVETMQNMGSGGTFKEISKTNISKLAIPLPPLEVQQEIVSQLDSYQKIIDGAKQVVDNYIPEIMIDPDWEMVELGDVIDTITPPKKLQTTEFMTTGKYPIIDQSQNDIAGWSDDNEGVIDYHFPLVIFGDHTCVVKYIEEPFIQGADGIKILVTDKKLIPKYLYFLLKATPIVSDGYKRHFAKLKETIISIPPLDIQKQILSRIEEEQQMVDANKRLVEIYQGKIKEKIDEVWGE